MTRGKFVVRFLLQRGIIIAIGVMLISSHMVGPAAAQETTVSKYFTQTRNIWVDSFKTCLRVWIRGKMVATKQTTYSGETPYWRLKRPRLRDLYVEAWLKTSCDDNAGYKSPVREFRMRQMGYHRNCDFNGTYSVSFPFSVSVTATPDCGANRTANMSRTWKKAGDKHHFGEIGVDGVAAKWRDSTGYTSYGDVKLCARLAGVFYLESAQKSIWVKPGRWVRPCVST